ncbi:MAG: HisA/HisF-related TIM barrel protein [Methanomassiliicoccales archaeon]|nr:HisA/HisF-related TIM barrel protein [Methanomassiliicoccales archaeon]
MTENIVACQYCGSRRVTPKILVGGPMAALDNQDGSYVCLDCGRELVPLGFEGEQERKDFIAGTETAGKDFLHIPIVPVDTWSLFNIPLLDLPLVQVAQVVELRWKGEWEMSPGVSFNAYWKAVGSKRYGAEDVLLMDLSGMERARPNFEALKQLMKRKYSVWLEMGVRDVQDIFDAFTLGAQNAMIGSLTCSSLKMLEEVIELSDHSVPLLYFDGEVRWGSQRFRFTSLKDSLKLLDDLGFEKVAVLDLRRLGAGQGFDAELAAEAIKSEVEIVFGGGVRETDLPALKLLGAVGGLIDPFTPVLKDLIISERPTEEERPLPTTVKRESPRGLGTDA